MALSDQEIELLRQKYRDELEEEHKQREERALRKANRRKNKSHPRGSGRNREEEAIKADVRSKFYNEYGYEEKLDPTGRRLYLSPEEIKNKQKKRTGKNKKSRNSHREINQWYVYIIVASMGIIAALALVSTI
jgi:hypothetical protein